MERLVQHYGQPTVDPATYKLRLTGFVSRPVNLTLDQLKRRPRAEIVAGFECGGSSNANQNRLCGNARWAGTSLSALLREAGPCLAEGKWFFLVRIREWSPSLRARRRADGGTAL